jgi:hypothetical protein
MALTFPTGSGALAPRTAIHKRAVDLTNAVLSVEAKLAGATSVKKELDDLKRQVDALQKTVEILVKRRFVWLCWFLMRGCNAKRGFEPSSDPLAKLMVGSGYASLDDIAKKAQATRNKSSGMRLYEELDKVYKADTVNYTAPPPSEDLELLYEFAVELTK